MADSLTWPDAGHSSSTYNTIDKLHWSCGPCPILEGREIKISTEFHQHPGRKGLGRA